jgi:hypothetical protein
MAHDSTHRVMEDRTARAERRLGLAIRSWKVGFVVLEGTNFLEWGVCRFPAGGFAPAIRRLAFLLTTYAPSIVIARGTRRADRGSSDNAARLVRKIRRELEGRSVQFVVLARRDLHDFFVRHGCANKNEIAASIADQFEQLKLRIPRSRKPWDPERNIVAVFDAAATVIAFDGLREPAAHN